MNLNHRHHSSGFGGFTGAHTGAYATFTGRL
jgi:hypothetical protein